jgi:hypothetical protein
LAIPTAPLALTYRILTSVTLATATPKTPRFGHLFRLV